MNDFWIKTIKLPLTILLGLVLLAFPISPARANGETTDRKSRYPITSPAAS